MAAYGRQKGIGSSLPGDRANSVMRPAVVAKPSNIFKHVVSKVNILSGFIRKHCLEGRSRTSTHSFVYAELYILYVHTVLLIILFYKRNYPP